MDNDALLATAEAESNIAIIRVLRRNFGRAESARLPWFRRRRNRGIIAWSRTHTRW
jgi:hypothetical protein